MRYPITIEPGTNTTAWGVVVPDLPGCFSAGDTLEEHAKPLSDLRTSTAMDMVATGSYHWWSSI